MSKSYTKAQKKMIRLINKTLDCVNNANEKLNENWDDKDEAEWWIQVANMNMDNAKRLLLENNINPEDTDFIDFDWTRDGDNQHDCDEEIVGTYEK